jgi:hypothetical protein
MTRGIQKPVEDDILSTLAGQKPRRPLAPDEPRKKRGRPSWDEKRKERIAARRAKNKASMDASISTVQPFKTPEEQRAWLNIENDRLFF